jgi:hypothetical protein
VPTVGNIFRQHAGAYLDRFGAAIPVRHRKAIDAIAGCRTPAMGGHVLECDECGGWQFVYHSCRNRACPECHTARTQAWQQARRAEVLPVRYFHVVFTVPAALRELTRGHQTEALGALLDTAVHSLMTLAADPRFVGGRIGVLAVLHTWTQALEWHPHVHCLVPGVGVAGDRTINLSRRTYLLPRAALASMFRAKFAAAVRRALPDCVLPEVIWHKRWVVFARPCIEGPDRVLDYLARYVFRGPLSSRRIVAADDDGIRIEFRDRDTHRPRTVRLVPYEFMRRYLQHVLPQGFHRVRYYGLWAPGDRLTLRSLQVTLAATARDHRAAPRPGAVGPPNPSPPHTCPVCGSTRVHRVMRWRQGQDPPTPDSRGPPP